MEEGAGGVNEANMTTAMTTETATEATLAADVSKLVGVVGEMESKGECIRRLRKSMRAQEFKMPVCRPR